MEGGTSGCKLLFPRARCMEDRCLKDRRSTKASRLLGMQPGGALGVIRARPVRRQCCCSSDQEIDPGRAGDGCSRVEGIAWVDVCATPSHSMSC